MIDRLFMDLRGAVRRLVRTPAPALLAVLTLASAGAAGMSVLSLVNPIFLRPISAPRPERLVAISITDPATGQTSPVRDDAFRAFGAQQRSLLNLSMYGTTLYRVTADGRMADVSAESVMPAYFELIGATPVAGRFPTDADADAEKPAAVVSERLWKRLFGDGDVDIGRSLEVEGRAVTVVGVTRATGLQRDASADLFLPVTFARTIANNPAAPVRAPFIVGRLAEGTTLAHVRAEAERYWLGLQSPPPPSPSTAASPLAAVAVEPITTGFSGLRRQYGDSLRIVERVTALLLAIACINALALLTVRSLAVRSETAIRLSLGANRWLIVRQHMIEGLVLVGCAFAMALPLAWWAGDALTAALSVARGVPLDRPFTPDAHVVAISALVMLGIGVVVGALPAVQTFRSGDGARRAVTPARSQAARMVLVGQVAVSLVLVVCASLFVATLAGLRRNHAGIGGGPVIWARLSPEPGSREQLGTPYFVDLVERISAIPGVRATVLSAYFPGYLGYVGRLPLDQFSAARAGGASALSELVSPGFFQAFGITQLRGRDFTWQDDAEGPPVTILSQSLASALFGEEDATGRRIRAQAGKDVTELEVIGVVADAPIGSIRDPHLAVAFRPMMQNWARAQSPLVHAHVAGDIATVREAYVRAIEARGRHFVRGTFTFDEWTDFALLQERLVAGVSTSAALLAVILACVGVYGLLAYSVALRTRELGVRMAVGATRGKVVAMVLREGVVLVAGGVAIGIPMAAVVATIVGSRLYGLAPTDPWVVSMGAGVLLLSGAAASLVPSVRASKIQPSTALRSE